MNELCVQFFETISTMRRNPVPYSQGKETATVLHTATGLGKQQTFLLRTISTCLGISWVKMVELLKLEQVTTSALCVQMFSLLVTLWDFFLAYCFYCHNMLDTLQ